MFDKINYGWLISGNLLAAIPSGISVLTEKPLSLANTILVALFLILSFWISKRKVDLQQYEAETNRIKLMDDHEESN